MVLKINIALDKQVKTTVYDEYNIPRDGFEVKETISEDAYIRMSDIIMIRRPFGEEKKHAGKTISTILVTKFHEFHITQDFDYVLKVFTEYNNNTFNLFTKN